MRPLLLLLSLAALALPAAARPAASSTAGADFYIVSSIDRAHHRLVLRKPTEVTLAMAVSPETTYRDEAGHRITLEDMRAGATVWIRTKTLNGRMTAADVQLGPMTVEELQRRYLQGSPPHG
jgi:hypothetical protein